MTEVLTLDLISTSTCMGVAKPMELPRYRPDPILVDLTTYLPIYAPRTCKFSHVISILGLCFLHLDTSLSPLA